SVDDQPGEPPPAVFRHLAAEFARGIGDLARNADLADAQGLARARHAIESEAVGRDDGPELPRIALSSGDWLGHRYGPRSREIELWYRQMDLRLGEFLDWLDDARGTSGWVLVLTSDHGVPDLPEWTTSQGGDAKRVDPTPDLEADAELVSRDPRCGGSDIALRENDEMIHLDASPPLEAQ